MHTCIYTSSNPQCNILTSSSIKISSKTPFKKKKKNPTFIKSLEQETMHPYSDYPPPYYVESSNNYASSSFYPSNQDEMKMSHMIRWNSGKKVDPRLLGMLEVFGEIYVERHEFFNKIFHGDHEEVFKKIGHALKKKKSMKKTGSMKRSMSMRVTRQRGISQEENGVDEFRVQRFKIKTPNVLEAEVDQPTTGSK